MMNILLAIDFENLHTLLRSLYDEMMPLCANMAGVARAIAGLGALFYIAYRVWQSLARAEAIDVFPLLRPFAIGLCILMFPTVVLGTLNAVMTPIVQGVATMLEGEKLDMQQYREQKDKLEYEAMKRNPETAYLVSNEEFDKQLEELGWSPGDLVTMTGMYVERGMKTKTAARMSVKRCSGSVIIRSWFIPTRLLVAAATGNVFAGSGAGHGVVAVAATAAGAAATVRGRTSISRTSICRATAVFVFVRRAPVGRGRWPVAAGLAAADVVELGAVLDAEEDGRELCEGG